MNRILTASPYPGRNTQSICSAIYLDPGMLTYYLDMNSIRRPMSPVLLSIEIRIRALKSAQPSVLSTISYLLTCTLKHLSSWPLAASLALHWQHQSKNEQSQQASTQSSFLMAKNTSASARTKVVSLPEATPPSFRETLARSLRRIV